jgi:hypothetical protein
VLTPENKRIGVKKANELNVAPTGNKIKSNTALIDVK